MPGTGNPATYLGIVESMDFREEPTDVTLLNQQNP